MLFAAPSSICQLLTNKKVCFLSVFWKCVFLSSRIFRLWFGHVFVHQKCTTHCVFTMHFHDFVSALVNVVMCKLEYLCVFSFQYNALKRFRLTNVSIKTLHDGAMFCILQWSVFDVMICKYSISGQTPMFYKALLPFCLVDLLRAFQLICSGRSPDLLSFMPTRWGALFGFPLAPPWPEPEVCFDIACSGWDFLWLRFVQPLRFDALA